MTDIKVAKPRPQGRRRAAIDMAKKTRLQLEREVIDLTAAVTELRRKLAELEAKAGVL